MDQQNEVTQKLFTLRNSSAWWPVFLVLLALFVEYVRLQNIFPIFKTIRAPFLIMMISAAVFLSRAKTNWSPQTLSMLCLLGYLSAYIVIGRFVIDSIVRNDGRAFQALIGLTFCFFGISFPIANIIVNRASIFRLCRTFAVIAFLLSIYSLSHSGKGPGGWVGDENDCCFAILTVFPFFIFWFSYAKTLNTKLFSLVGILISLLGIAATMSRGGFIGLVLQLGYLFFFVKNKLKIVVFSILCILLVTPFIPSEYYDEIASITKTNEGTAEKRKEYWETAFKVWIYPSNILFGVGPDNSSYWLGDFQEKRDDRPSFSGRQTHSLYFQLLPDLGLVGLVFFGIIIGGAFRKTSKIAKVSTISQIRLQRSSSGSAEQENIKNEFINELSFLHYYALAINMSFVGALGSGLFISVLYYPPVWILVGVAETLSYYATRVNQLIPASLEQRELKNLSHSF